MKTKSPSILRVFFLQKKATELCAHLYSILQEEKTALIGLKTDKIMALSTEKEHLISILKKTRQEMQGVLVANFAIESSDIFETVLFTPEKEEWLLLRNAWLEIWEKSKKQIESNQRFMTHSLKNISSLIENLKGLCGQKSTYSSSGSKVEQKMRTRVVEGRY